MIRADVVIGGSASVDECAGAVLERIAALPDDGRVKIIAIDGRAAAGKSTLAARLGELLGAGIVHMDDFFLPAELRTPERLSEVGGNVHYERFIAEVLPRLSDRAGFEYRRFDCAAMSLGAVRAVAPSMIRIVEGAYSLHHAFGEYMDLRVFADIEPEEQRRRIIERNGIAAAEVFERRWIPLEEKYIGGIE